MKIQNDIKKILGIYFLCVTLSLSLMFLLMGFFKVRANSEYALNAVKPEYVTMPDWMNDALTF